MLKKIIERNRMRKTIKRNREALGLETDEETIDVFVNFNNTIYASTLATGYSFETKSAIIADGLVVGVEAK